MARVKGGTIHAARRKKVLKQAKGYFGSKHKLYKTAKEQVMHSLQYAYRDRRQVKRNMRKLWITRINAACRINNISYSKFINGLTKAGIEINRKMLSEIAINDPAYFTNLVEAANKGLAGTMTKPEVKPIKETKKAEAPKKETVKKEEKVEAPKKETAKKAEPKNEKSDLSSKTVAELKELAEKANIADFKKMKKAELLEALK